MKQNKTKKKQNKKKTKQKKNKTKQNKTNTQTKKRRIYGSILEIWSSETRGNLAFYVTAYRNMFT